MIEHKHWHTLHIQPVYFHTTVLDSSLLMVVEVVLVLTPKDPLLNQPNQVKKQSAGWCIMRLFATGQTLKSTNEKRDSEIKKLVVSFCYLWFELQSYFAINQNNIVHNRNLLFFSVYVLCNTNFHFSINWF